MVKEETIAKLKTNLSQTLKVREKVMHLIDVVVV
jgi:hypothetical protein